MFRNHYFAMRHGESVPNVRGVILSHLEEGKKEENTLTKNGEEQARASAREAKAHGLLDEDTIIYSSPFSRCRKTAEIAREVLGVPDGIVFDDRLRERWFGNWEGTGNANYKKVWDSDARDANHHNDNAESTAEVTARVSDLIHDLEETYSGRKILLVSHGDALQILQAFFEGVPSSAHRGLKHLAVAEIRMMN